MNERTERIGLLAAWTYATVAYVCALVLVFLAAVLTRTHAASGAPIALIPGLLFAALAPFICRGNRWAMITAFAVSLLAALAFIADTAPKDWWIAPPFPLVFGILTAVTFVAGAKTIRAREGGGIIAEVYAAVGLLGSFVAIILLPVLIYDFASTSFRIYLPVLGMLIGIMSVLIWGSNRWAMIGAFAVALLLALLMADHVVTPRRWLGMSFPIVFGICAVAGLLAGTKTVSGGQHIGEIAAEVYAALVYLYSVVVVFLAPSASFAAPPGAVLYLPLLGLIFGALSVFIWRGRVWAMISAFVLSLMHWLVLASFHPSFWGQAAYWAAPAAFGIFTVLAIATTAQPKAA
jgi:hypothetical protein